VTPGEPDGFAAVVCAAVELIPPGRVLTYGDVADYVGTRAPRAVGAVLARWGHELPWHRVVLATGRPAPGHEVEALRRLRREGTPLSTDGTKVDLPRARWDGC
jgi:alkylated DNA nucleotide flippase Atl1